MTEEEVRQWIVRNSTGLTTEEKDHIAKCLHHLWLWYKEDFPVGDFLQALIRNDFKEAVCRADEINIKNLRLYAWFIYNEMPYGWNVKLKKEEKKP